MSEPERRHEAADTIEALPVPLRTLARAGRSKKASDVVVLDLRQASAFTDYFLICSGQNQRQVNAIVEAIEEAARGLEIRPSHVEGGERTEWVLMDFFDFVVHVFTPETRSFYALERLWGSADRIPIPDDQDPSAVAPPT